MVTVTKTWCKISWAFCFYKYW